MSYQESKLRLNGGVRTSVHDRLMGIWVQLLKSAGFVDVRMEVRDFDAGATSADKDHRRPDIVCYFGGVRYIIDLTIACARLGARAELHPAHIGALRGQPVELLRRLAQRCIRRCARCWAADRCTKQP